MLGQYSYHQIFRKSLVAFGTCFNNIIIKRKTGPDNNLEALKVPIKYGPTQKALAMIAAEPEPERQGVQINLPAMSFEIKGIQYDPARKLTPTQFAKTVPPTGSDKDGRPVQYSQFVPVPYNLNMQLSIAVKNTDDGFQIIEQILPNFHPSMNVSIEIIDVTHEERDIAIVLNGVELFDDYEGDYSRKRTIVWTLNFTVKTWLFGPVSAARDIRKVIVDYRTDVVQRNAELRYTAEVKSTATPPVPRDEIDPNTDAYTVVETYQDIYSADDDYYGL